MAWGRSAPTGSGSGSTYPITRTCEGRLTLTSGTPVTTSDVTAATTVYFTPYQGGTIAIYDTTTSKWALSGFSEISVSVPNTANTNYDVFIYDNSGTLTLQAVAWTNNTTRATAITLQDGVYVKSGAAGYRYLGSFRTTGTAGQTEDSLTKRYVWNYYHRSKRRLSVYGPGSTWSYATNTWRSLNNDSANRVEIIAGLLEDDIYLQADIIFDSTLSNPANSAIGIGEDVTNANSAYSKGLTWNVHDNSGGSSNPLRAVFHSAPSSIGYHAYYWLEIAWVGTVNFQKAYSDLRISALDGWIKG